MSFIQLVFSIISNTISGISRETMAIGGSVLVFLIPLVSLTGWIVRIDARTKRNREKLKDHGDNLKEILNLEFRNINEKITGIKEDTEEIKNALNSHEKRIRELEDSKSYQNGLKSLNNFGSL